MQFAKICAIITPQSPLRVTGSQSEMTRSHRPAVKTGAVFFNVKVRAYIDGFNLYNSLPKSEEGVKRHRWLNLDSLLRAVYPSAEELDAIKYFTAANEQTGFDEASDDSTKSERQQIYWRALRTLPNLEIIEGFFHIDKKKPMPRSDYSRSRKLVDVIKIEEKGSDVNLATHLLCDAFDNAFERALVVSNDSDLVLPIKTAVRRLRKRVGIVIVPRPNQKQPANDLRESSSFHIIIPPEFLAKSQFPPMLEDGLGKFSKPRSW